MPTGVWTRPDHVARFHSRVDSSGGPDACWPWTGKLYPNGYGKANKNGANAYAHRRAYEIANGEIPAGLQINHRPPCVNRACCNPAHLYAGTAKQNTADMIGLGRHAHGAAHGERVRAGAERRGEANPQARLTESDARDIVARHRGGERVADIAASKGVCRETVYHILAGKAWQHVTSQVPATN